MGLADIQTVVLVANNENGATTQNNCNNATGNEQENCDDDQFFYQQNLNTKQGANFFDDQLLTISAYEIKGMFIKHDPSRLPTN
jgi:hypothetical protein